ncbi:hypothetical protein NQ317_016072, partial [Molorchus minor]
TIIDNQVICICNDGHVFGYGGQWKDGWVLEGGPRRRLNYHGEWLAVWGKAGAEHPQPWSPIAKNHQRANLHLYWIGARDPELLAYKKTDGEPLQVAVSKRAGMYETAFLLAVDIGHHDLFMDLHYIALKIDESEMAAAARAQASALLSRCSSEASNCSRSSCSQCCDSASSSSNDYSPTNRKEEKDSKETTDKLDHIPSVVQNSDSCLTSDRTSPEPISPKMTTEKEIFPTMSKLSFTPRATYVKSPQVPSNFTKVNLGNLNVSTPPLPFTPPLPTLHGNSLNTSYMQNCTTFKNSFQSSAGFPYNHPANVNSPANFLPHHNFFNSNISNSSFMSGSLANISSNQKLPHHPLYSAFSSSNLSVNNIKKSFTPINKVLTPPLPSLSNNGISSHYVDSVIIPSNLNQSFANHSNSSSSSALISSSESSPSTTGKKHQPKVKFSDTVTAFIVPEIKRPQRPPPPPHITDPQKELADSLPLCHPNEDYLKDFAPAKKDDNQDEEGPQSKIKVEFFELKKFELEEFHCIC